MSAKKKKVSAFAVYKQRKQQDEEGEVLNVKEESRNVTSGGQGLSEDDIGISKSGRRERGDVGKEEEAVMGVWRKRKRKSRMKLLSRKRRKMESSCEMMESADYSEDITATVANPKLKGKTKAKLQQKSPSTNKLKLKETLSPVKERKKKIIVSLDETVGSDDEEDISSVVSKLAPPSSSSSSRQLESVSVDGDDLVVPFFSQFNQDDHQDSREAGLELLRLLINPLPVKKFFTEIWEQRPILLKRNKPYYNSGWFSTDEMDRIIRENDLEFSVNLDITSYQDGERLTHNPEGKAMPQVVWDLFQEGCSIRLLNPQTYSKTVWLLTATLQEHFQSFVGANVYLTPAGTQGFAPHSDDIEAFVMQLEGKKHWKLYHPRTRNEVLPRFSSPNLKEGDLGEPILDVVLEPGDLLYFPRGIFHQAESHPDVHSLHITLSTYQMYTWGDLISKLLPAAVERALDEDVSFRRGLPLSCLDYIGSQFSNADDPRTTDFVEKLLQCMKAVIHEHTVPVLDGVMDQIAAANVHSSLPPCLSNAENASTVEATGKMWDKGELVERSEFSSETEVKLVRYNAVRLVTGSEGHMVYYNQQNSRVYQEKVPQCIPITVADVDVVRNLIESYPAYVTIRELCQDSENIPDELELFYTLYSHSIISIH